MSFAVLGRLSLQWSTTRGDKRWPIRGQPSALDHFDSESPCRSERICQPGETAFSVADSGYSTLLMPDFRQLQPSPGPTLAAAATLTGMRVGTWVYASPLRPTRSTAWEAHSLSVLTERRFEMGIGTGRPGIEDELRDLGMPVVPPSARNGDDAVRARRLRPLHARGNGRARTKGTDARGRHRRYGHVRTDARGVTS